MDDKEIISMYFTRDENAIKETDCAYGKQLSRLSFGILKNSEDSKEAVDDTYLKTWNAIPPQNPVHFYAFIAKICRHICFGILDYQKAQKRNFETVSLSEELENCIPDKLSDTEMRDEVIADILTAFLGGLSKDSRLIFLRRYWFCDPICEIAARYNISESKVKTSLHRARKRLKVYLEREGISI